MNDKGYPALYKAADSASIAAQRQHFGIIRGYSYLLVTGAGLSVLGIQSKQSAIFAALILIFSVFLSFWMILKNFESTWYRTRAVAESVKTSTWRFMMRAEPYEDSERVAIPRNEFRNLLRDLLQEHHEIGDSLSGAVAEDDQITQIMLDVRAMSLAERIDYYRTHRVDEQRKWYARKSGENRKYSWIGFGVLIGMQVIAIMLVVFRVAYPEIRYWPTEIFVVAAGATLTWIQAKRYRELSSSYSLTAHEIGIVRAGICDINSEEDFSDYVKDAENAFSREHTQWLARRDV
jgi:hypothetical protein